MLMNRFCFLEHYISYYSYYVRRHSGWLSSRAARCVPWVEYSGNSADKHHTYRLRGCCFTSFKILKFRRPPAVWIQPLSRCSDTEGSSKGRRLCHSIIHIIFQELTDILVNTNQSKGQISMSLYVQYDFKKQSCCTFIAVTNISHIWALLASLYRKPRSCKC